MDMKHGHASLRRSCCISSAGRDGNGGWERRGGVLEEACHWKRVC